MAAELPPVGVSLSPDVEHLEDRATPFRARVRWVEPGTGSRRSKSEAFQTAEEAQGWIDAMARAAPG